MATKKYYAVARGHRPGIYDEWYGEKGAESRINGFQNALYKGFSSLKDAEEWLSQFKSKEDKTYFFQKKQSVSKTTSVSQIKNPEVSPKADEVTIYTDGGCHNNPGPGGYGVVLIYGKHRKELSGGFRRTTNNRMELMACIMGLKKLKRKCSVTLYSDSKYVVNGITKGWARRWQRNGWMRNKTDRAENADLWVQLLDLCNMHDVKFVWVKGHAGNAGNERCDQLATQAASQPGLPPDTAYEN
ncbi:ribonuclease HI [Desulfonema magnum]|uniref:Ribonuclease H n=1 Tax=Desulfonema magnum TaxID=45655 RepID=A0A975BQN5_9BACT|nr:ribonuclease HI [Desulfonema magnum]QTA89424.1 Ribonuclease H [Desulfonema magnum]